MGKSDWYDMREFLNFLEKQNDLFRIKEEVDPEWEVNGISRINLQEYGPCLYFEKVKGGLGAALSSHQVNQIPALMVDFPGQAQVATPGKTR